MKRLPSYQSSTLPLFRWGQPMDQLRDYTLAFQEE